MQSSCSSRFGLSFLISSDDPTLSGKPHVEALLELLHTSFLGTATWLSLAFLKIVIIRLAFDLGMRARSAGQGVRVPFGDSCRGDANT